MHTIIAPPGKSKGKERGTGKDRHPVQVTLVLCSEVNYGEGNSEFYSYSCALVAVTSRDFLHYLFNTLMRNWNITLVLLMILPPWAKFTILVLNIKGHI